MHTFPHQVEDAPLGRIGDQPDQLALQLGGLFGIGDRFHGVLRIVVPGKIAECDVVDRDRFVAPLALEQVQQVAPGRHLEKAPQAAAARVVLARPHRVVGERLDDRLLDQVGAGRPVAAAQRADDRFVVGLEKQRRCRRVLPQQPGVDRRTDLVAPASGARRPGFADILLHQRSAERSAVLLARDVMATSMARQ
jgi:hypothetical protein